MNKNDFARTPDDAAREQINIDRWNMKLPDLVMDTAARKLDLDLKAARKAFNDHDGKERYRPGPALAAFQEHWHRAIGGYLRTADLWDVQ